MRLPVLVDIIAIAAGIAVILLAVDGRAEHAAQDRAGNRALPDADARDDCARNRTSGTADSRATDDIASGRALALALAVIATVVVSVIVAVAVRIAVLVRVGRAAAG